MSCVWKNTKEWRHDIQKLDLCLDLHCEKCRAEEDPKN